jgi:hypothetical protein
MAWETDNLDAASDFEDAWKSTTEVQKLLFLIRFDEIKKISKRSDIVKATLRESRFDADLNPSKKDLFAYRFCAFILLVTFISTLIFVKDIRFLIISLSICYVVFKSLPLFFQDILGDFYNKDRNKRLSEFHLERRDIEIYFKENTHFGKNNHYMLQGMLYAEHSLENYIKNSLRFRYHLLNDCKNAFK